jgi:hypothetical protein
VPLANPNYRVAALVIWKATKFVDGRRTGGNPFRPSRDPLAAILPLFPRCLQFPIPLGLNLVLIPASMSFGVMYPMALFKRTLL